MISHSFMINFFKPKYYCQLQQSACFQLQVLTSLDPLAGWNDSVEDFFTFWFALHRRQSTGSSRGLIQNTDAKVQSNNLSKRKKTQVCVTDLLGQLFEREVAGGLIERAVCFSPILGHYVNLHPKVLLNGSLGSTPAAIYQMNSLDKAGKSIERAKGGSWLTDLPR